MARIALIGPGAIGGTAAAALAQTGRHDLVICANRKFDTLTTVHARTGEKHSSSVKVITDASTASPADWVLIAVKSHQTPSSADWLKRTVGPNTKVAVLQNGVEHRERVAPFIPAATQIVPVVVTIPAERIAPGEIKLRKETSLTMSADAVGREFADLFGGSFVSVALADDFQTRQWEKLCLNAPGGAISALTLRTDAPGTVPGLREVTRAFIAECIAVGAAEGAKFADGFDERLLAIFCTPGSGANSMYYDRRDGKATEWDARNAAIQRFGRKNAIATPISDVLVPLLRALDP